MGNHQDWQYQNSYEFNGLFNDSVNPKVKANPCSVLGRQDSRALNLLPKTTR
jgi:hypothetical protein